MSAPIPSGYLPAVDAYLAGARPFARPLLSAMREAFHAAVPEVVEAIKWSRPFFLYRGVILGNMAAFTRHCSLGLWGSEVAEVLAARNTPANPAGMGTFGRITTEADLPSPAELEALIRQAAALIETGARTRSVQRVARARVPEEPGMPAVFADALERQPGLASRFAALSPSCRREYLQWIEGARREETRARRVASAVARIAQGEGLHDRYRHP